MGMFDYVECRMPLPDGDNAREFQTKDFNNTLSKIIIHETGFVTQAYIDWGDDDVPAIYEEEPFETHYQPFRFRFYDFDDATKKMIEYEAEAIRTIRVMKVRKLERE